MAEAAKSNPIETRKERLRERQIGVHGFRNTTHQVDLTENQTIEDTLRPEFWAAACVAGGKRLKPDDLIEVRHVQKAFFAQLYVLDVGDGWAKMKLVSHSSLVEETDIPEDAPLTTRWNVGLKGYEVIRKADNAVLSPRPFRLKADAVAWGTDHLSKLSVA